MKSWLYVYHNNNSLTLHILVYFYHLASFKLCTFFSDRPKRMVKVLLNIKVQGLLFRNIFKAKKNYMFLRHSLHHFQPAHLKIFYCIPTNKCEKS